MRKNNSITKTVDLSQYKKGGVGVEVLKEAFVAVESQAGSEIFGFEEQNIDYSSVLKMAAA